MHHPHHFHHHSMSGDIAQEGNCLSGFSTVWTTLCSLKWPVPDFYTWDWRQHARMRKVRVGHQRSRKYFHKLSFVCCRMRIYVIYYPSSMWTQLPRESKVFKNFYWCMFENTSQYQSALSSEQSSVSYSSLLFFTSKGIGTIIAVFHSEIEEIGKIEKTGSNAWFIETTIYEYSHNIDPDDLSFYQLLPLHPHCNILRCPRLLCQKKHKGKGREIHIIGKVQVTSDKDKSREKTKKPDL